MKDRLPIAARHDLHEPSPVVAALAAGVAHALRNPLFGMTATLDALDQKLGVAGDHAPYVRVLRGLLDRIAALTQSLVDLGSEYPIAVAPTSAAELIGAAVRACSARAERAAVAITIYAEGDLAPVLVDRERTTQVFIDILDDAIHASPPGGHIEVVVMCEAIDGRAYVACEVRDEGPGFRAHEVESVFEPFFSKRRGSAGLGLAVARRVVHEQGGTIRASNCERGGWAVCVSLPRV